MNSQVPISIIIPNWNGAELLRRYLPTVIRELQHYNSHSECIVVDDGSTDDSVNLLEREFPDVRILRRNENLGFGSSVNAAIHKARNECLLLLNNDVALTEGSISELHKVFEETPDVFSVAALQKQDLPDGQTVLDGFNSVRWHHGHLQFANCTEQVVRGSVARLVYCTAGCSLFSRNKLLELGGFCEIFDPFYYEDAELGLRAAERGWQLCFAPKSVVYHCPGTTSRSKRWAIRFVPVRNYFLLHWLILDDPRFWIEHAVFVAGRLVWWTLQGRIRYAAGFFLAILKLPELIPRRRNRSTRRVHSLREILNF
jgi:GT2 family glycosyltransferase